MESCRIRYIAIKKLLLILKKRISTK